LRIIVQKFGGTSVATHDSRLLIAGKVSAAVELGFSPVVVVSAIGRRGDPYATDTLIGLLRSEVGSPEPRELDFVMSCGELISCAIMCSTLKACGLDAVALSGGQAGIKTDGVFNSAEIVNLDPEPVLRHLRAGKVVVVAGFQGENESGEVTTLGRGGSDTTAAALGAALKAEVVEIYTDVAGIKTADPRLVPDARTIDRLTYDETFQMAQEGAKVIHQKAVGLLRL